MYKIAAILAFLIIPSSVLLAQEEATAEKMNDNAAPPPIIKSSRDFLMIDLTWTNWLNKPDSVKTKGLGYGFNAYLCYDFPIKKTKLSFAAGIGVSVSTVYLDHQVLANTDTGTLGNSARFIPDTKGYKRYKFSNTYLQAPFELRYFGNLNNRNKGFKAAIGVAVGTLVGSHTKAVTSVNGTNVKYKESTKRYLSTWNFAATARIGYGNFSLFGSYNITNVFKDNLGPPATPISIGICLSGL